MDLLDSFPNFPIVIFLPTPADSLIFFQLFDVDKIFKVLIILLIVLSDLGFNDCKLIKWSLISHMINFVLYYFRI